MIDYKNDLKETEPRRETLYKGVVKLIRAYANIADEMKMGTVVKLINSSIELKKQAIPCQIINYNKQ